MYDNYSKFYVYFLGEIEVLIGILNEYARGEIDLNVIYFDGYTLSVIRNKEYDEEKFMKNKSDFIFYPFFLELEAESNIEFNEYLKVVTDFFLLLKAKGINTTVSSNFENLLPLNGTFIV